MSRTQGFLCKIGFLELAKPMVESIRSNGGFDANEARHALARAPLQGVLMSKKNAQLRGIVKLREMSDYSNFLDTYGLLLGAFMQKTKEKCLGDIDIDVLLLEEYFQIVLAQEVYPYVLSWYPQTADDVWESGYHAMQHYSEDDPHRQGLAFVQCFLRSALWLEAREAQKKFNVCIMPHSLNHVIGQFEHPGGHPVLRALVVRNPALIERLLEYFDYQLREQVPEPTHLSSAFGQFYRALVPLIAENLWAPTTLVHCEQLWMAHALLVESNPMHYADEASWEPGFAARLVHESHFLLHRSLHHLLHKAQLKATHIAEFFPLPLGDCSVKDVLPLLVQLGGRKSLLEEGLSFGNVFLMLMREHHPRVANLLTVHLAVFADAKEAHAHADMLLAAFENAIADAPCSASVEAIDNLGANVFEYEDAHSLIGLPTR